MTTKPLTILTGINRTSEPSSGSLILVNDLYRAMPDTHTIYLGRTPVDQAWKAAFDHLIPLSTKKRPQGPGFADYVDELTREVGALVEKIQPNVIHAQYLGFALSLAFSRTAGSIPIVAIAHGPDVMAAERSPSEREGMNEVAAASAAIVAPTSALADRIDRLTGRRFTDRLTIIPWGIRLNDAQVRDQPPTGIGPLSLVHAGRLDDNKSTITAVEALALDDVSFGGVGRCVGMTSLAEHLVSDELWELFRRVVPETVVVRPQGGGRRRAGDRECLTAIVFVATSGCSWRQLPPVFGPAWPTVYRRFARWSQQRVWARLHRVILDELGAQGALDWSRFAVDSVSVRALKGGS